MLPIEVDDKFKRWASANIDKIDFSSPAEPGDFSTEAVLAWERKSKRIYWGSLLSHLCDLEDFRLRALEALEYWPTWRPEDGDRIDGNNWSNGYLPGAWGLLGGDRETFDRKGSLDRLPSAAHWKTRSTNHGIVIMATYLVGAMAIGAEEVCREELKEVVSYSVGDGCYSEGINYLSFILEELAVYLRLRWDGTPWYEYVERELPGISGAKEMLGRSMGLDDEVFITFGDVRSDPILWRNGMLFANSLSDKGDLRPLMVANRMRSDPALEPFVKGLPAGGKPLSLGARTFDMNMAHFRDPETLLWIIGSRVHKTHNVDHDRGSFFYQHKGISVGEGQGRQAFHHNVILLKDAPDYPDCQGALPFDKRKLHGSLRKIGEKSWRVRARKGFSGYPSMIDDHLRDFHLIEGDLIILDRVRVSGNGEPIMHFNTDDLQSLWGHSVKDGRTFVTMRKIGNEWVGAAALGSGSFVSGAKLLYRGRELEFPQFETVPKRRRGVRKRSFSNS